MDDLSGLDWSSTTKSQPGSKPPPMNPSNSGLYNTLRPSPSPMNSGRNTPLSTHSSGGLGPRPAPQPQQQKVAAVDSFSNLVNFGSASKASTAKLSLKEQQERLEAEKRKKLEDQKRQAQSQYGDGQFWDALGSRSASRSGTPGVASPPATIASPPLPLPLPAGVRNGARTVSDDDDLFAAFKADTKVDNASHYPPPVLPSKAAAMLDLNDPTAWNKVNSSSGGGFDDDDDPFGLNEVKSKAPAQQTTGGVQEDDFLGDLGRPVQEIREEQQREQERKQQAAAKAKAEAKAGKPIELDESSSEDEEPRPRAGPQEPFDKAVAQLMDYGFSPEDARRGLTESGAGLNVQAAVNWLLDDAHRKAKQKANGGTGERQRSQSRGRHNGSPAWMSEGRPGRSNNRSPANLGEGDFSKTAAAMGSSFLKQANSLWKTGQKKVQQAVQDFQHEPDPSQPKWMRSAQHEGFSSRAERAGLDATDEALMLSPGMRPDRNRERPSPQMRHTPPPQERPLPRSGNSTGRSTPVAAWQQPVQPSLPNPKDRLNKQAIEEQSSQMYVSSARRKKTPQPSEQPRQEPEPDLLFNPSASTKQALPQRPAQSSPAPQQRPTPRSTPKPQAPPRQIPPLSAPALQASTRHRTEGTAHFKRGDYAAAHASYTASLTTVPPTHPLAIVLLTNRALTALKTGEPRQAVADADAAALLVGPGEGRGEHVDLLDGSGARRDMRDLFAKALARKAEALEQMEKWADAGAVWQACVAAGVGGAAAAAGRQRCQKALAPKPVAPASASAAAAARPKPAARPRPPAGPAKSAEAVDRLRAANKAAEAEGDEKFALADRVDARVAAWRDGKRENLRALLGSLENVLWEGSGWKKVGLHEVVMANKVKVVYMKAIAKTHPDKLPQDASTEVRMIAGTVFATLNEAWDKFKAENGL